MSEGPTGVPEPAPLVKKPDDVAAKMTLEPSQITGDPSPPEEPRPQVDTAFWFGYSKDHVQKAIQSRDDAAGKLQQLVIWLWGLYNGAAALGFTFSGKDISFLGKLVVAMASTSLMAVYWLTVRVQMPVQLQFDPRVPESIRRAYNKDVVTKDGRLRGALMASLVSALLVAGSFGIAATSPDKLNAVPSLTASIYTANSGSKYLSVSGVADKVEAATICFTAKSKATAVSVPGVQFSRCMPIKPTGANAVQATFEIDKDAQSATVALSWEFAGQKTVLTKEVAYSATPSTPSPTAPVAGAANEGGKPYR